MPRRSSGPHLWFQKPRRRRNSIEQGVWVIRDGKLKRSTGFDLGKTFEAQQALANYIIAKSSTPRIRDRDPAAVKVSDVIAVYSDDVVGKHARPHETASRLRNVAQFCRDMTLADINTRTCHQYAEQRGQAAARRELEDLRAAIAYHWKAGLCLSLTPVSLPEKGPSRQRWLTRDEAARLLWTAIRRRQRYKLHSGVRPVAMHIARFMLVAMYTGTRAGAICGAALEPTEGRGWVDLENGVFYRRGIGRRETKKRQTPVRLPPRLLAHMRRWKALGVSREYVVEWNGLPVKRINKAFRAVRDEAGLPDVTPHTLRHTCGTWLAQAGVPAWEIAGYLGMTVQVFEQTYGHHHKDYQRNAVNAFGPRKAVVESTNVVPMFGTK